MNNIEMIIDVNRNQTKKGIKVQFVLPNTVSSAQREEVSQKLKLKLNEGLQNIGLSVDVDLDVPYENVIGFLIRLESIKLMIKNIIKPS